MMYYFRIIALFASLLLSFVCHAQMAKISDRVWITVGDSLYPIAPSPTQCEVKPGWNIADVFKTSDKAIRYLWGKTSHQVCDNARPRLVVQLQHGTLHDIVLVRLQSRKQYRRFPKADIRYCDPIYVDLTTCRIELLKENLYAVTPERPLRPGEYILTDLSDKPMNDYGDRYVYAFTISK